MGANACAPKPEYSQDELDSIKKIQGWARIMLAQKVKFRLKTQKLAKLFSIDKVNHQIPDTMMLTQRIGAFKYEPHVVNDGEPRVFHDYLIADSEERKYKGEWQDRPQPSRHKVSGKRDGLGILLWTEGIKYEGQFKDGFMCGYGRKIFANGEYYEGFFANDKANGVGVFRDLNGGKYEGEWKDDRQHGRGTEIWSNGRETYIGEFSEGKKNGKGKFMWSDGSFYEGDFVDGLFEGVGVYYFKSSEKTYTGTFISGKIEGEGEQHWADGREYYGQFKDGKEEGEGTFKYANGNKYIGKFKDGKMEGYAIFLDMTAMTKRHGEWREGKRMQWLSSPEVISVDASPVKRASYV